MQLKPIKQANKTMDSYKGWMGAKDLAFFSKYFDLVPLSVDAPWLFLVC
jgi:hypothetical protein